jgi:hypothetical protein
MLESLDMSRLGRMPRLYETTNIPCSERIVHLHFMRENGEWFAVEYDPSQRMFYGYIDFRPGPPHWGFFGLDEVVECWIPSLCKDPVLDMNWIPKKTKEISGILGGE